MDMETGMRGYLLAGKEKFLEPYKVGEEKLSDLVGKALEKQTMSLQLLRN